MTQLNKLSRREFLKGASLTASAVVLGACAPGQTGTASQATSRDGAAAGEAVELELWTFVNNLWC